MRYREHQTARAAAPFLLHLLYHCSLKSSAQVYVHLSAETLIGRFCVLIGYCARMEDFHHFLCDGGRYS